MKKQILISADIKSAKAAVKELDGLLKDTAKSPKNLKLFDKEDKKALSDWASKQIPEIRKEMDKVKLRMKEASDTNLFLKSKKELNSLESQLKKLEKIQLGKLEGRGGEGILGGKFRKLLGPAALLGMGAAVVKRGMSGYGQRVGEAQSRLGLMGAMGPEEYQGFVRRGGPYSGRRHGYDVNETLEQANQLIRSVGDLTNLEQVQKVSRAYGFDTGETIKQMGDLRKVGGKENTQKNFATLLASAISSNLDQGLLAEYMNETATFTKQIASEGTADTQQIMRAVSGLVRQGGILSDTGRTTRNLGGVNAAIQGAQGSRFGFYAQAMENMLGPNAGGSDVLLALNQGLFGADTSRLGALTGRQRKDLGLGGAGVGKRTRAITGQFEELTGGMDTSSKAIVASKLTGIKDAAEALNFMQAMKSGQFDEKTLRKMEQEAKATPMEKAISEMNNTLDKRILDADAHNKENLSKLGEAIAPSILGVKEEMLNMEARTLVPIAQGVGSLVEKFVGTRGKGGVGEAIGKMGANIFSGGRTMRQEEFLEQKGNIDLLQQLQNKGTNIVGQKGLRNLYDPGSAFGQFDLERVQGVSKGANQQQLATIQMKAWDSIMDQSRELAIARKEGKKLPNEAELMDSIKNLGKLIPKGVGAPNKLKEEYGFGQDEGLVPHLKATISKAIPGRPEMQEAFDKPTKKAPWDSDKFDKLIEVNQQLIKALEGNKRSTDKNTTSKGRGYANLGAAMSVTSNRRY